MLFTHIFIRSFLYIEMPKQQIFPAIFLQFFNNIFYPFFWCGHFPKAWNISPLRLLFPIRIIPSFFYAGGNNAPTLPTLEAVYRAFGITLAQFLAEGDESEKLIEEQHILFSRLSPLTKEQKRLLLDLMKTM